MPRVAMKDAHSLASCLHRDISTGNIILVREEDRKMRRGYLVDWDASCDIDDSGAAAEPGRAVRVNPRFHFTSLWGLTSLLPGNMAVHV